MSIERREFWRNCLHIGFSSMIQSVKRLESSTSFTANRNNYTNRVYSFGGVITILLYIMYTIMFEKEFYGTGSEYNESIISSNQNYKWTSGEDDGQDLHIGFKLLLYRFDNSLESYLGKIPLKDLVII